MLSSAVIFINEAYFSHGSGAEGGVFGAVQTQDKMQTACLDRGT
jgi:hypothetical protein